MIHTETKEIEDQYQSFIHKSRYARWLPTEGRREHWPETVDRYLDYFGDQFDLSDVREKLRDSILNMKAMPSMRAMMTAGVAAERDNMAIYNCAFVAVEDVRVFSEIIYVLMCGTGVGFSVESRFINRLPNLPEKLVKTDKVIVVEDSRVGWAEGLDQLLESLWSGLIPTWDLRLLRPAGTPLKTFGGRSSGPAPLASLFKFVVDLFSSKYVNGWLEKSPRLRSIDCHDIVCKIADVVVVGGVRRSALISLSNLRDKKMAKAKVGEWWLKNGQRALANNSVCYTEKPSFEVFMEEWLNLYKSKCGERGTFSRAAANRKMVANGRRKSDDTVGCNPLILAA